MTDLLKDVLTDRADAMPELPLHLDEVMRAGERRIRRRRTIRAAAAAVVAVTVVAGGMTVVRSQRGGTDADPADTPSALPTVPGPARPSRFTADKPTWSDQKYIHYGDQRIAIEGGAGANPLVKTPAGFIYADGEGRLVVTDGRDSEVLGPPIAGVLAADPRGTLVAWIEWKENGAPSELVVYDARRRYQVLRSETAGESSTDGSHLRTVLDVLGMDGTAVYLSTDGGVIVRRDLTDGSTRSVPGDPMTWQDVAAGTFVHDRRRGSKAVVVGTDLAGTAPAILATRADLSPNATLLATDFDDKVTIRVTGTLTERPLRHPSHPVISPAQWLDDDRLVVVGYRTRTQQYADPVDVLVCTVSAGSCELLARDIAKYSHAIGYFDDTVPDHWKLAFVSGRGTRY